MRTTKTSRTWVNTTLYPFKQHFVALEAGNMHYVDEGEGPVILFVHGTPTWSFIYRDFIKASLKDFRCIAIDHLGFGLSDKNSSFQGTSEWHARNLSEFITKIDLQNITIVVHDFGGPIGLAAGIQHHKRIKRVVMFNTWLWATKHDPKAQKVDRIINSSIGKFLYLFMNFSVKVLLKRGFSNRKNLTKEIHSHYRLPFPNRSSRLSLLNIGKSLVGSSDWYQEQWEKLFVLEQKPWLIIWGIRDEFITAAYLEKWLNRLPEAIVKKMDCGHFIQEEKTQASIKEILRFMAK